MSIGSDPPSSNNTWTSTMEYNDGKKVVEKEVQIKRADTNYLKLYGLRLLAGTNFNTADTTKSILINETYARVVGFQQPQLAVGKMIKWDGMKRIIGVLADFHQKSLHEAIKPIVLSNSLGFSNSFNIALQPQNADGSSWTATIAAIQKAFRSVYPDEDCDYEFVDQTIAKYYTAEKNTARLLLWATGLAIFISCLGLLGLVIYITNQRTKEIGIRKVIGASVTQIVVLLSRDFVKLIGVAILIAMPIAWWGSNKWLDNFAYRTTLSWWIFVAGGVTLLLLAITVLCLRAFRAARANPVESLRSE
jgi:putative ABC transport system permease protein